MILYQDQEEGHSAVQPGRNFRKPEKIPDEAQPREVHIRCASWQITRFPCLEPRHRGESVQDSGCRKHEATKMSQGRAEVHWVFSFLESVREPTGRKGSAFVPADEKDGQVRLVRVGG